MTVQELIEFLQKIQNKSTKIFLVGEYCNGQIDAIDFQPPHSDFDKYETVLCLYMEQ